MHGTPGLAQCLPITDPVVALFPTDVDGLVPQYLLTVPVDPLTGKSMRITQTEGRLTIYSVGPDLNEDAGKTLDRKTMKGDVSLVLSR